MRLKINDAVRQVMKESNTTQTQMAKLINARSQSVIAERLKTPNLSIDTVIEMLDAIGYELVIEKRKQGRTREGKMIIGRSDE